MTQSPSVNSEDLGDILNEIILGGQEDSPLGGGRGGALGDIEELPSEEDRDEDDEMKIEMQYMDIRENILALKKLMGKDENGGGHSGSSGIGSAGGSSGVDSRSGSKNSTDTRASSKSLSSLGSKIKTLLHLATRTN